MEETGRIIKICKIESIMKSHFILPQSTQRLFTKYATGCKTIRSICERCMCFVFFVVKNTFRKGHKIQSQNHILMKRRIIVVVLLGWSLFASAQKNTWTIGLSSGIRGEIVLFESQHFDAKYGSYDMIDDLRISKKFKNYISMPPVELSIAYKVASNVSLSSGLVYVQYQTKWQYPNTSSLSTEEQAFREKVFCILNALQIPLTVCYDVPVKNTGLSFFAKSGLNLDVLVFDKNRSSDTYQQVFSNEFQEIDGIYSYDIYSTALKTRPLNNRRFNLMVNTGMGISYKFKSGIGISLSGAYNIGLLRRAETLCFHSQVKYAGTDILRWQETYQISNRNEYWNVLFGISYTFKKREK